MTKPNPGILARIGSAARAGAATAPIHLVADGHVTGQQRTGGTAGGEERPPSPGPCGDPADSLRTTVCERLDALFRYVYFRVGRDTRAAEELVQETVCAAIAHRNPPRVADEQEWWLRGIAKNMLRRHWRRARGARETGAGRGLVERLTRPPSADEPALRHDETDRLMAALSSLAYDDQELLFAFYRSGRTTADLAAERGVTAKSVELRLYRARGRLRDAILAPEDDV